VNEIMQSHPKCKYMNIHHLKYLVFLVSFMILGCSSGQHRTGSGWTGYTESGQASYYADTHQFKKTASGELYKHKLKTAAHKTIPFGTKIKVINVKNGQSVVVKINDRGPFVKYRIIDLSKSAFSSIGNISSGLIDVQIEVIR